ncbi:MAG: MFS transporter [Phenylobacterium sp.]|uniref:MFS transporter n=1 Tax=Phenylobacterium sp. TaxID=1871053 RepID=UPI003BB5A9C7
MTHPPVALTRDRDFMKLWAAQAVSTFGARITREGLPMTAVLTLGASPATLGVLAALSYGPAFFVGLFGGGFVDRRHRRPVLIATDLIRAGVLITVPIAAWLGWLSLWQVFAAAVLVGGASVLFDMADHAYLPALIGTDRLVDGNSKLSATESVAELGGPALAGFLFQWLTAPFAIAVNAVTYLVSAVFLMGIQKVEPDPEPVPPQHWVADLTQGFRVAWAEPRVRPLLVMTATNGLFGGGFAALYLLFALRTLHLSPAMLGITVAFGGLGALIGAGLAAPLARRLGAGSAILSMALASAASAMLIPLSPAAPVVGMAMLIAAQLLGDSTAVIHTILAASLRQTVLPQETLGRAAGAFKAAGGGTMLIGALAFGALGNAIGVRETLFLAAAGLAVGPLIALASPALRRVKVIELDAG